MIDKQGLGPFGRIKSTFASLPTPHQRDRALSLLQLNIIRRQSVLSYRGLYVSRYRVHTHACTVTVTPAHPPLSVAVSL